MIRDVRGDQAYWDKWAEFDEDGINRLIDELKRFRADPKRNSKTIIEESILQDLVRYCGHTPLRRYSRGDDIESLRRFFPPFLDYMEQREEVRKKRLLEGKKEVYGLPVWKINITFYVTSFWWVGLALALNIADDQWNRLIKVIDNEGEDELLDRIIATRQKDRKIGKKLCFPEPYKLLLDAVDAVDAPKEQQAQKLFLFVDNWYQQLGIANRPYLPKKYSDIRPYWYYYAKGASAGGGRYFGYWCIEAVAAVKAFGLDDSLCLGHENYPGDLLRPNGPTTHINKKPPRDYSAYENLKKKFVESAKNNNLVALNECIAQGVEIEAYADGTTALLTAVCNKHEKIVDRLIECGADVNSGEDTYPVLHYAINTRNVNIIKKLIEKGANVNIHDERGKTGLMKLAATGTNCDLVEYFLNKGAKINDLDDNKYSALSYAVGDADYNINMVKTLLDYGADIEVIDNNGETPLMLATGRGRVDCVVELMKRGADVNHVSKQGVTALGLIDFLKIEGITEHQEYEYDDYMHELIAKLLRQHGAK